jgi:hypothetical protein
LPWDEQALSDNEKAAVIRLIRVMRMPRYWVGPFIEYMLAKDAASPGAVEMEDCKAIISDIKAFMGWSPWFNRDTVERASIIRYAASMYFPDKLAGVDVIPPNDDDQFYELARMWRAEHPAPPKKQMQPAGLLGQADKDDDD